MIREFRVRSAADLGLLRARLARSLRAWASDWFAAGAERLVTLPAFADGWDEGWHEVWACPGEPARWCGVRCEPFELLAAELFGTSAESAAGAMAETGIVAAAGRRALADLAGRVLAKPRGSSPIHSPGLEACEAPEWMGAPGAGTCELAIGIGHARVECVLSPGAADAWLDRDAGGAAPGPRLTSRREALLDLRLDARAIVGFGELSLESLSRLAVGDVIELDQRVDHPSELSIPGLPIRCGAYLCERNGRSALVVAEPTADRPNGRARPVETSRTPVA